MPHVDDRIREELRRLLVPVDGTGAFERVVGRGRRLRTLRRFKLGAAALALVALTVAGTLGLVALFDRSDRARFGGSPPVPTAAPRVRLCGSSSAVGDLDGDGTEDRIEVGVPLPKGASTCDGAALEGYVARIDLGPDSVRSLERPLRECEVPGQCWVLAVSDLDRDGRAEVAIGTVVGASTLGFSFYWFDAAAPDGPFARLAVAAPGDPFDELYGLATGASTFSWYGSVTHQHWVSCGEAPGLFALVTALRDQRDPGVQDVHTTVLRIAGGALVVETTRDARVPDGTLEPPTDLCGSPLEPLA